VRAGLPFRQRLALFYDIIGLLDAVAAALPGAHYPRRIIYEEMSAMGHRQPNPPLQNSGGDAVQDLINSFVRLSAAMSVYSLQQVQSAAGIDPRDSVAKLKKMIDSMTEALTAQIDESKMQTVDSISNLGSGVVERTFETVSSLNPRDIVENTNKVVRKTTDSIAGMLKSDKGDDKKSASTPQGAGEVLAAH
jgi:hypothetical protein